MMIKNLHIKDVALTALTNAYKIHEKLGPCGKEMVKRNQFDEKALRVDVEAEKGVIQTLRHNRVPIKIVSEEHGTIIIGNNPEYLGILDGLDGSSVYKKSRGKGRYGTMFAIFSGLDPKYSNYLFSGAMEHSTGRLFYAMKKYGAFVIEDAIQTPIYTSGQKKISKSSKIYIDEYFDINRKTFLSKLLNYNTSYLGSSCTYYVDLASGKADLVLECTRKNNLEIAVAYGLITEAGGAMMSIDKTKLGQMKYNTFGQHCHIPVVTASTKQLALNLIDRI